MKLAPRVMAGLSTFDEIGDVGLALQAVFRNGRTNQGIAFMTTSVSARALSISAAAWFCVAALGQLAFVAYMALFYGPTMLDGEFIKWTQNKNLITGYQVDDTFGNLGFILHIAASLVLTLTGVAQLLPALRARAPAVHRWSGRIFLVTAVFASVVGFWLVWARSTQSDLFNSLAISLNGVLIIVFAGLALRAGLQRRIEVHQAWAMRLWLVANGVWFLRVGMAVSGAILVGALGQPRDVMGAVFAIWGVGSFLAPLAIYEAYRFAKRAQSAGLQWMMTAILGLCVLLTAGGAAIMTLAVWVPLMRAG